MRSQTSAACLSNTNQRNASPEEKERAYARKRYRENPALYREYQRKYAFSNRRARYCNLLVHLAIKNGKLTKQPCELCGNPKVDAHHDDYSKPFAVRWLCRSHHKKLHSRRNAA